MLPVIIVTDIVNFFYGYYDEETDRVDVKGKNGKYLTTIHDVKVNFSIEYIIMNANPTLGLYKAQVLVGIFSPKNDFTGVFLSFYGAESGTIQQITGKIISEYGAALVAGAEKDIDNANIDINTAFKAQIKREKAMGTLTK